MTEAPGDQIRLAILVVQVADPAIRQVVRDALAALGIDDQALHEAEHSGFLRMTGGQVTLGRPALAVADTATAEERRRVHGALATAHPTDPDRRLWHLAQATEAPDGALAMELAGVAGRTGDPAQRSRIFALAAELSTTAQERGQRLLEAGRSAHLAGTNDQASALLTEALATRPTPLLRAHIQHERGRLLLHGDTEGLHAFLVAEADLVAALDPGLAGRMLADASIAASSSEFELARATIERAGILADGIPDAEPFVAIARASILAREGTATDAIPLLSQVLASAADRTDVAEASIRAATVPLWREDYRAARRVLVAVVGSANAVGSRAVLPVAMDTLAAIDVRTGHWPRAHRTSSAALRLAMDLGQRWQAASCLTTLAGIEAARGAEQACRRHLGEAREFGPEDAMLAAYGLRAEALLELGRGAFDEARQILERLDELLVDSGFSGPHVVTYLPDLVETAVRAGRPAEAVAAMRRITVQVANGAPPTTVAMRGRCAGLLAEGPTFNEEFELALRAHERAENPFERARTELCYGERLRRVRRRSAARLHLERATATFERLGATPWLRRARRELGREGTPRATDPLTTAHERQVVTLVVAGATNNEAARALYLSPKTIEHHLSSVYRKLGVRSRTELVRRWMDSEERA